MLGMIQYEGVVPMLFGHVGDVFGDEHWIQVYDDTRAGRVRVKIGEVDGQRITAEFDREVFWKYVKPTEAVDG